MRFAYLFRSTRPGSLCVTNSLLWLLDIRCHANTIRILIHSKMEMSKLDSQREFIHESCGEHIRVIINPGSEDRIPLLICNGFGQSLETLDPIVKTMAGTTVIRFDVPGIGGSRNRFPLYRFSHLARVLDELIEALGYQQVDIYGLSWGGMLAQELALTYPHRCRKLILAATLPGVVSLPGNILLKALFNPGKWLKGGKYSTMASLFYGGAVLKSDCRSLAVHSSDLPGFLGQMFALCGWTSIHRLHKLTQPTLLLYGKYDSAIPMVNALVLQKIVPDARLIKLDCGHLFPWTRSVQVFKEISNFRI